MTTNRRGTALLAVLWLSAALSAIAFTVANSVRSETERTATDIAGLRARYLASAAIDRALLYIQWGGKYFQVPTPMLKFNFPTGIANVEIIPETAKLNVNSATPIELRNLVLVLTGDLARAQALAAAIVDWRSPGAVGAPVGLNQQYLSLTPTFPPRHASFQEIEELLLVPGVTTDLFYGSYTRDDQGRLVRHAALRDCLSIYGSKNFIDINTAEPALMQAIGVSPEAVTAIVARRLMSPIVTAEQLAPFMAAGPGAPRLSVVPSSIATLRATARPVTENGQLSDVRRSASAMVKFLGPEWDPPFHIMRWYDNIVAPQ